MAVSVSYAAVELARKIFGSLANRTVMIVGAGKMSELAARHLRRSGASHVFGLSTQSNEYQTEMASRLHLPFPVLSDEKLALARALNLPTMEVAGLTLIKRLALIIDDAKVTHVFYPVFPPDRNAGDVLDWLKANPAKN